MLAWLTANLGTILIVLVLAAVVIGIVAKLRKDKKKGNASCCGDCAFCGCHCPQRESGKRNHLTHSTF